jgi:glycosyltransferase involved in cell wall biosynthesis
MGLDLKVLHIRSRKMRRIIKEKANSVGTEDDVSSPPDGQAERDRAKHKQRYEPRSRAEMKRDAKHLIERPGQAAKGNGKSNPLRDHMQHFDPGQLKQPEGESSNHAKSEKHDAKQRPGKSIPWPAVLHGCYRHSRAASATVASMLSVHWALGTWRRSVSRFIALSEFARGRFIAGGLPAEKIAIKPNFVDPDPGIGSGRGNFALFVGRFAEEKGIGTLLAAWSRLPVKPRLKIIGDGPLAPAVANAAATIREIEWLGPRSKEEVSHAMGEASILIVSSTWYEGFPLVVEEGFAAGLPIIASRIGSLAEVISNGETGRLVSPGDPDELSNAVSRVFSRPQELQPMRLHARSEFERKYTAEANYARLLDVYEAAMASCPK